jgi:hypothetical protein
MQLIADDLSNITMSESPDAFLRCGWLGVSQNAAPTTPPPDISSLATSGKPIYVSNDLAHSANPSDVGLDST